MEFVQNNIWLFLIAVVSGGMLLWPLIAKRVTGAREVGPLEAVQLIRAHKVHLAGQAGVVAMAAQVVSERRDRGGKLGGVIVGSNP